MLRVRVTSQQLAFCENLVSGMNQSAAYRLAYPGCRSEAAARANASRLLTNDNLKAKVTELQSGTTTEKTLSWQRKREMLAAIATDPCSTPVEILAAIKVDNQMAGHDKPEPSGFGTGTTLWERILNKS